MSLQFAATARLADPSDNVAIATKIIPAGAEIDYAGNVLKISHTVLEGHRFALKNIAPGEMVYSWGFPFGTAMTPIAPGDYLANAGVLTELATRDLDFALPETPNFNDNIPPYVFDAGKIQPTPALEIYPETGSFEGYARSGGRGAGTRNMIVLLGTSALTGGFVRALEAQLKPLAADYANIDGIVAVAHTEGGHTAPNNRDLLLRTLAGFMVHPNVGAVLAVDYGSEPVNNAVLQSYMQKNGYALDAVPHQFMSLTGTFEGAMENAAAIVKSWLKTVDATTRTTIPLSELKIALQCGGSDAFSGVSGNPLIGWVAREVIRHGGAANVAETDELIGAEAYILAKVRDVAVARKFMDVVDRFREWAGWHGHNPENNPSGGNKYRGLYNIYLKSLGAAAKRNPEVPLDAVIDYGEPMTDPGFYFMDSPGNDLESIAGQVAAGCNMIFFVTGNGSITNFPFVPTLKVVTTTDRYNLLPNEMDVNAGEYVDGRPLDDLGAEMFDLTLAVASGQLSVGEQAHHAQVQIWRDWAQTATPAQLIVPVVQLSGTPLPLNADAAVPDVHVQVFPGEDGHSGEQVGLIMPTSLCSGQVARLCVESLNAQGIGQAEGISRWVTLVHTEGCGATTGAEIDNTLVGYLTHPGVRLALLLEHGCEKTHNAHFRHLMLDQGRDPNSFGWASVQLDGGIQAVIQKMKDWAVAQLASQAKAEALTAGPEALNIGIVSQGGVSEPLAAQVEALVRGIVGGGGSVVFSQNDGLLQDYALFAEAALKPTLGYGQHRKHAGLHIMDNPSRQWTETLTGLGATGADVIIALIDSQPMPGHPFIPVMQMTDNPTTATRFAGDFDLVLTGTALDWSSQILDVLVLMLERRATPVNARYGNTDFQITRGLLNVSL